MAFSCFLSGVFNKAYIECDVYCGKVLKPRVGKTKVFAKIE